MEAHVLREEGAGRAGEGLGDKEPRELEEEEGDYRRSGQDSEETHQKSSLVLLSSENFCT